MKDLIKKQMSFMYRNKLFWAGICFLIIGSYLLVFPLFHNFSMNNDARMEKYTNNMEVELSGIERSNYMMELIIGEFKRVSSEFPNEYDSDQFNENEYQKFREEFQNSTKSFEEIDNYIIENFNGVVESEFFYKLAQYKKVSYEDTKQFVANQLDSHRFSYYFGKKYADYFGMLCFILSVALFPFIFYDDLKKNISEVIHTKRMNTRDYICGKIFGSYFPLLSVVFVISISYSVFLKVISYFNGFEFSILEMWFFIILSILPSLFVCCIISSFIAIISKSVLPAIPVMVLYFLYSNLPVFGAQDWTVKPLTLFLRYDGELFDTVARSEIMAGAYNQIIMMAISVILLFITIRVWGGRSKWAN